MILKKNVRLFGVSPMMLFAYGVAHRVYEKYGNEDNCVITSARDGKHKRSSDHYLGFAIDLRVWDFSGITIPSKNNPGHISAQEIANQIENELTDEFEVFFEGDHIHIGFDPDTL